MTVSDLLTLASCETRRGAIDQGIQRRAFFSIHIKSRRIVMTDTLDPSSSRSFSPLATLPLSSPHHLHPGSCNPAMDLVVLLAPVGQGSPPAGQNDRKGKGRAVNMSDWKGTKIALWRMLGSKVWEVEMKGWVGGLAWSRDGQSPRTTFMWWCHID